MQAAPSESPAIADRGANAVDVPLREVRCSHLNVHLRRERREPKLTDDDAAALSAVTLVVVAFDAKHADLAFLEELAPHFGACILVDNGPEAHSVSEAWRVLRPASNLGFGAAANLAAREAVTPMLLFLNPDIRSTS